MIESSEMFLTVDQLECRMRELEQMRFVELASLKTFSAMPGELSSDDVYCRMPERVVGEELAIGDLFAGRDRYLWAQKTVALPSHQDGFEVYGLFDFGKTGSGHNSGFESLLYVDGEPFQGVDTNHNDVNFESLAGRTVELTFMLWTGLEGGGEHKEFQHRISQADVGYLHQGTDELHYLAKAIVKTLRLLDADDPNRYALKHMLEQAFDAIDWDKSLFYQTVGGALHGLKAELNKHQKNSEVTVNVVGHTHIDVAWLWRLKHTREKAIRSFSTVLQLMNEFDDYIFLQSQPQLYAYVKQDCPALYAKIKERVSAGRWEADGGMWLEADCNLTSGEALTRQFLYGVRFMMQEFGHRCRYLWLPDVFGYSWALPQIMNGFGINAFVTSKISWNQYNTMPHDLFKWRGMDGSEVTAYFLTIPEVGHPINSRYAIYNGMISPRSVLGSWKKFRDKDLSNETLVPYGYGDGGGGVNRNMLKMRRAMDSIPGLPNVRQARAGDFLMRMQENIKREDRYSAVWDGELYLEYHRGTYTSQAFNKRMNRQLEFALAECEWLSVQAKLAGGDYEQSTLAKCWQTLLRNQFHDIIPGSSIHEVYLDSREEYAQVGNALASLADTALQAFSHPLEDAWTIWHFGSFLRTDEVLINEKRTGYFETADGEKLLAQRTENGYWISVALPALSGLTVRFFEEPVKTSVSPFRVDLKQRSIHTPYYMARWDENGSLTRLIDLENDREVLAEGEKANVLEIYEDKPLRHDNWDVDIFHLFKHEQAMLQGEPSLISEGSLRVTLRFHYAYRHSTFEQDVTFYSNNRRIDFETRADWHEEHRLLKAAFPVRVRSTKATYDIQYGHVERPTHFNTSWDYARFEVVAHKWADLSEDGYGVSLLNNCKYGHSVHDHVMRITLLKSGKYPDPEADMGLHEFTYALLPHMGSVSEGNTIEEAVKLNLPARVARGISGMLSPLFFTDSRHVMFDAIKKAEDDDCLIVRIHECRGGRDKVVLHPDFKMKAWSRCNLLEETKDELHTSDAIETMLAPFEIQTFKVWTE